MLKIREPETIHVEHGRIENGTFTGRWHFSFGDYYDPDEMHFGKLRVFNDDTLSPGSVWPLHPHREIEVVTYCAGGVFRHADERGVGGVLRKGWVQHTTVGSGMWHSEINDRKGEPMRFIQMWFMPEAPGLAPSVEQMAVEQPQRTNKFLKLVGKGALPIHSKGEVYSAFVEKGVEISADVPQDWGGYLYVLEGGGVEVNGRFLPTLGAVKIYEERLTVKALEDAELLLVMTEL